MTLAILDKLPGDTHRVMSLPNNVGKAEAIRNGFKSLIDSSSSEQEFLGYIDSDSAFDPIEVSGILRSVPDLIKTSNLDSVWMSRVKLAGNNVVRSNSRHFTGRLIATFLGQKFPNYPYDTQCGFKIFRVSQLLIQTLEVPFRTKWFVDLEIFCRYSIKQNRIMRVEELPVRKWTEISQSRIRFTSFPRIAREVLITKKLLIETKRMVNDGSS